jgi:hypothetical protein
MLPAELLDLAQAAARQHQKPDRGDHRRAFRAILLGIAQNFAQ